MAAEELDPPPPQLRPNRRKRRTRRGMWNGRRAADWIVPVLKWGGALSGVVMGYDIVQVDADKFTAQRVQVERMQSELRTRELEAEVHRMRERLDAIAQPKMPAPTEPPAPAKPPKP